VVQRSDHARVRVRAGVFRHGRFHCPNLTDGKLESWIHMPIVRYNIASIIQSSSSHKTKLSVVPESRSDVASPVPITMEILHVGKVLAPL
jgi:hypothetical protein